MIYTGIGSRQTPKDITSLMSNIASALFREGYTLRSGSAPGADLAFERGAWSQASLEYTYLSRMEIYLPWRTFQQDERTPVMPRLEKPQSEAYDIAAEYHPRWKYLRFGAKALMARNVHQVLGPDVTKPIYSNFIICWTKGAKRGGGTGQTLRIAEAHDIPIYDMASHNDLFNLKLRLDGSFII